MVPRRQIQTQEQLRGLASDTNRVLARSELSLLTVLEIYISTDTEVDIAILNHL